MRREKLNEARKKKGRMPFFSPLALEEKKEKAGYVAHNRGSDWLAALCNSSINLLSKAKEEDQNMLKSVLAPPYECVLAKNKD